MRAQNSLNKKGQWIGQMVSQVPRNHIISRTIDQYKKTKSADHHILPIVGANLASLLLTSALL